MAFEDADTLSYVLAHAFSSDFNQPHSLPLVLDRWEKHRSERISKVIDFTNKSSSLRRASITSSEQARKEWLMWGFFKWSGLEGGARWMYTYSPEEVLAQIL